MYICTAWGVARKVNVCRCQLFGHHKTSKTSCNFFDFQLQDEIQQLRQKLHEKEEELAEIKKQLGITAFTEFKQSMAHGLKVVEQKFKDVQESET